MKNLFKSVKKSMKKSIMKDMKDDLKESVNDNKEHVEKGVEKMFDTNDSSIVKTSAAIGAVVAGAIIIGNSPKTVLKATGIGAAVALVSSRFISGYSDSKYAEENK